MIYQRTGTYFFLLVFISILVLYHLFAYTGHFGYDDLHYAELAVNLLQGDLDVGDHYAYRFPVILLTAIFYLIFGITDLASSLPALIITITILVIVFNILKEHGPKVLIIGLSLCTLSNWFLFYSDKLMPDIYVALSVIWALAIIHNHKFKGEKKKTAQQGFLLALALLFGFMSKGTIVLVLPLMVYLIVFDIIFKRDLRFWTYSLLSGLVLMSLYLLLIWIFTGNPFQRFDAIAGNSYLNLCSYDQQSTRILLKRIFWGFFELSIYQSLATAFIFIFATLFQRKGLRIFRMENSFSYFQSAAVILFLSSSFMTISLSAYAPMCLDPRHYLFLVPVAAIPAARVIVDFLEKRKASAQILSVLTLVALVSYFLEGDSFWKLYLPLTVLFILYSIAKPRKLFIHLFFLLFALILLIIPVDMARYAQQVKYRSQRDLVVEQVLKSNQDRFILSNEVQKRHLEYYSAFREDQAHRFISYQEYEMERSSRDETLLLLNWYTRYLSGMQEEDLPIFARQVPPDIKPLFSSDDPDLSIYNMKDLPMSGVHCKALFTSYNDFENKPAFWDQEADISDDISYEGRRSNAVSEFSSTFNYPMDSLQMDSSNELLIQCSLFCYADDQSDARLVVSIENDDGPVLWKALEMNRYIKAYSNWWPVQFDVTITHEDLKKNSRLKVYVWKKSTPVIYIDNFSIEICTLEAGRQ